MNKQQERDYHLLQAFYDAAKERGLLPELCNEFETTLNDQSTPLTNPQ